MSNWLELNKGNLGFLYHVPRKVKPSNKLAKKWEIIYDEYIKKIGLTPEYIDLLEAMKRHALIMVENALNPTSLNGTKEAEARSIVESMTVESKANFNQFVAGVEKYMGIPVDLSKITVERFYGYVNLMQKEMEATIGN